MALDLTACVSGCGEQRTWCDTAGQGCGSSVALGIAGLATPAQLEPSAKLAEWRRETAAREEPEVQQAVRTDQNPSKRGRPCSEPSFPPPDHCPRTGQPGVLPSRDRCKHTAPSAWGLPPRAAQAGHPGATHGAEPLLTGLSKTSGHALQHAAAQTSLVCAGRRTG